MDCAAGFFTSDYFHETTPILSPDSCPKSGSSSKLYSKRLKSIDRANRWVLMMKELAMENLTVNFLRGQNYFGTNRFSLLLRSWWQSKPFHVWIFSNEEIDTYMSFDWHIIQNSMKYYRRIRMLRLLIFGPFQHFITFS